MAKAKTKFKPGDTVQVREGVPSPEFPDVVLSGWSGVVEEVAGKKEPPSYLVEWDDRTLAELPSSYLERCEQQGLYHKMMWMDEPNLEPRNS